MSYRDILKKQISELEEKIAADTAEKAELENQLHKLKMADFEEDLKESHERRLLQEGC